jgi:hypothetical protein
MVHPPSTALQTAPPPSSSYPFSRRSVVFFSRTAYDYFLFRRLQDQVSCCQLTSETVLCSILFAIRPCSHCVLRDSLLSITAMATASPTLQFLARSPLLAFCDVLTSPWLWGSTQSRVNGGHSHFPPQLKQPEREADHSLPTGAENNETCSYISTLLYIFTP